MADRDDTATDDLLTAATRALRTDACADPLALAAAALRAAAPAAPVTVGATRARIVASLERRGHGRRKRVIVAALLASLGTGTLSWAAATGRVNRVLVAITQPAPAPAPAPATAAPATPSRSLVASPAPTPAPEMPAPLAAAVPVPVPDPVPVPVPDPVPVPAPVPAAVPVPVPAPSPAPVRTPPRSADDAADLALYRLAHAAHFHAADPAAALAAWDAYLAARPAGRFAVEARYNRAVTLIRLDRIAEARAALAPFAAGEIAPAGYRAPDARALLDALDHGSAR